ncbi:MAG: MarR family transcriptional regulator [Gammaproteobacteria bacterium]|nr:MarR family transcriptional regulator [Gammaproteobacteria bacterium]
MSKKSNKTGKDGDYMLEQQIGHLMRKANQRHTVIFAAAMKEVDLTPMQFAVMAKIKDEEEVSQNLLGRLASMDPATVQGVVKRLAERDLIAAKPDVNDRRRHLWTLSKDGEKLLKKALPVAKQITESTLEPLSQSERQAFARTLKKLT